jgi:hypothetical protein
MLVEYPPNWKNIVSKIKQRDLLKCVLCGSDKRLEVHHTREKSIPENLITLCYTCHQKFANSYCGFKKKIREFNDLRLSSLSCKEITDAHQKLIGELNKRTEIINELKNEFKSLRHKLLNSFF